ncbi:MAG: 50S ribosomal protein L24 [candidate division Zixibacteria bacterium CG_4_9_14_3_um_filter_46_8]|nr:MAG: 50S ribosomal protein L24 [candidate division Zixibacteria bacterium CG_4_9_14_3_um_filter_46_8]
MRIKKDDTVRVISGNDRGKTGKVLVVFPERRRIIIEGVNMIKRHSRPSSHNRKGGIISKEASIDVSNVMYLCNRCNSLAKLGSRELEDGKRVRICKKCGEII